MISVVILTFNSQCYLKQVLSSLDWAQEILCIDSGSSDETLQIAASFSNVRIISQPWLGFGAQKQVGIDAAKNEWVLILDSDEVMTKALASEIQNELKAPKYEAYKVARLNFFFSKPIKQMGLYPDYTIRLFKKSKAKMSRDLVHERVLFNGKPGKLKEHFIHHAYESVEQFIAKQNHYSSLNAKGAGELGSRAKLRAIFSPFWCFVRLFVLRGGWRLGWRGYVIARLYAQYNFWKQIK